MDTASLPTHTERPTMIAAQREPTATFRQLVTVIYGADLTRTQMVQMLTAAGAHDADTMSMADLAARVAATANAPGVDNNSSVTDALSDASGDWCDSTDIGDWNVLNADRLDSSPGGSVHHPPDPGQC